jgi:hypothetical protein
MLIYCVANGVVILVLLIFIKILLLEREIFKREYKRNKTNADVLNEWLSAEIDGTAAENLTKYFTDRQYNTIAIYGFNVLCESFLARMRISSNHAQVKYVIDKNGKEILAAIPVCQPQELKHQGSVDVVVVALVGIFDEVKAELSEIVDCPIISLKEVIYEM